MASGRSGSDRTGVAKRFKRGHPGGKDARIYGVSSRICARVTRIYIGVMREITHVLRYNAPPLRYVLMRAGVVILRAFVSVINNELRASCAFHGHGRGRFLAPSAKVVHCRLARAIVYSQAKTLMNFVVSPSQASSTPSEKPLAPTILQKLCRLFISVDRQRYLATVLAADPSFRDILHVYRQ